MARFEALLDKEVELSFAVHELIHGQFTDNSCIPTVKEELFIYTDTLP